MSTYTVRAIIVVTAARAAQANTRAQEIDPVGGHRVFIDGLSATGQLPATHYWCSWALTLAQAQRIRDRIESLTGVRAFNGNQVTPQQVLDTMGLKRIVRLTP